VDLPSGRILCSGLTDGAEFGHSGNDPLTLAQIRA